MSNLTEKEKKEIARNKRSDIKNQTAGFPWGLKVNMAKKMGKAHDPLKYSKEIEKLRAKPDHTRKGYKPDKGSFIDRLEAHKREAASFDNGTWKPSKKGESFIDALERHKSQREFY